MKLLLTILLSISYIAGVSQRKILVNGQKYISVAPTIAKWNFTKTAFAVTGNNNVIVGDPTAVGNLTSTDATTGWVFKTNNSGWLPYFGSFAAMNNGEGGTSASSPTYLKFSADELQGGWLQAGKTYTGGLVLYPMQVTNMAAGTYVLDVISNIKLTSNSTLVNCDWHVKWPGGVDSLKTIAVSANNLTELTFTGLITSTSDTLKFGVFNRTTGNSDGAPANGFHLKKIL